ncbi:hypothetical protein J4448_00935 [Candidatus Woesearchaeota archaeon]|nr:hypothetical protein [Candidatus Woesearchaeota archaeon]
MADEEELVPYKDISELKRELEGMKGKKDVPANDIYDAVQKLAQTMTDMLEVFGAATEQMKLEEGEYESEARKHEMIISKLDKLIEQNRTIAEGMVAIVEMVKEKIVAPAREELLLKPRPEPKPFMKPEWQPRPEPVQRTQPMMAPPMAQPMQAMPPPNFGMQLPPMQPAPSPDLDFPEEPFPLEDEPRKKGLFGMFKK